MSDKDPWNVEIGARLRAAMTEGEIETAEALAAMIGETGSRVRNWANGTSRPMVPEARRLKATLGVTLDWLYEGDPAGLPGPKAIRLALALQGERALLRGLPEPATSPALPRPEKRARAPRARAKAGAP